MNNLLLFDDLEEFLGEIIFSSSSSKTDICYPDENNIFSLENDMINNKNAFSSADHYSSLSILDDSNEKELNNYFIDEDSSTYNNFVVEDLLGVEYNFLYCDEQLDINLYNNY